MEHLRINGAYWGLTTLDLLHKISAVFDAEEVVSWVMKCYHEDCGKLLRPSPKSLIFKRCVKLVSYVSELWYG